MTETSSKVQRVLVVDDHSLFAQSVSNALREPGVEVRYCGSIREALRMISESPVDLVLLDHDLGAERASHFLPAAHQAGFTGQVLVVTARISENEARRLLRQGVSGIFLKHAPLEELKEAMRVAAAGGKFLDRSLPLLEDAGATDAHAAPMFSDRQRLVLRYVVDGLSNKEIAWRMQISESYVKSILQSLFQKTGVRTRGQLVRVAFEQYEHEL